MEQIYSKKELDNLDKLAELERRILSAGRTEADLSRGATTINQKFQEFVWFWYSNFRIFRKGSVYNEQTSLISMFSD